MTAKEYLEQIYVLDDKINSDLRELKRMHDNVVSLRSPGFEHSNRSGRNTEAPFIRGLDRVLEMEKKIDDEIDMLVDMKEKIRDMITRIPDHNRQMILRYRYLEHMPWSQIVSLTGYSRRWVFKTHEKALKSLSEKMH